MVALVVICSLVLATGVVLLITSPLRRAAAGGPEDAGGARDPGPGVDRGGEEHRAELESAREAKYREIRDAELDRQTGHLSESDFATIDAGLRSEAIDLLKRLDRANQRLAKLQRDARPETLGELTADAVGDGVVEAAGVAEDPEARYHRPRT